MPDKVVVIKRDGREVPFDRCRISNAILKAADEVQPLDTVIASELADKVCTKLFHKGHCKFPVEEIQDEVVEILTSNYPKIATAYALYRQRRTDIREMKSVENKIVSDVVFIDAKDNDDARENANINADAPAGAMLKIGAGITKEFYLRNLVKPEHAQMHREGKIHIHDADWSPICWNCLSIPLGKLLKRGFSNGHGTIRPPVTIGTAAILMCIVIQANQNQMFGGQAIPMMDYDLAPYVAKSYVRNLALYLETHEFGNYADLKKDFIKPLDNYIDKHGRIIDDDGYAAIVSYLEKIAPNFDDVNNISELFDFALKKTDRDTHQAMEATVHNLCSLASRAGSQVPFSSVNFGTDTSEEGRLVSRNLLYALNEGLGAGETAIFPISIFKLKKGINRYKGEPNYDLFELACEVSAKRLFPKQNWGSYVS